MSATCRAEPQVSVAYVIKCDLSELVALVMALEAWKQSGHVPPSYENATELLLPVLKQQMYQGWQAVPTPEAR